MRISPLWFALVLGASNPMSAQQTTANTGAATNVARAVDGKATEAALRALATALGVRRGDVSLVTGASRRTKLVDVVTSADTEAVLTERVRELRTIER